MGARRLGFTLAIALPGIDEAWLAGILRGMFRLADRFGCPLVGGDTTRGPLAISDHRLRAGPRRTRRLRRDRAQRRREIWGLRPARRRRAWRVAAAHATAPAGIDAGALRRLDWPEPRVELGLRLRGIAQRRDRSLRRAGW